MPLIEVTLVEGRSAAQLRTLVSALTQAVAAVADHRRFHGCPAGLVRHGRVGVVAG